MIDINLLLIILFLFFIFIVFMPVIDNSPICSFAPKKIYVIKHFQVFFL